MDAVALRQQALLPFPDQQLGLTPTFVQGEQTPGYTEEDMLLACRRLGVLHASAGEGGFQEIGRIMGFSDRDNYFSESGIEVDYEDTVAWETMFRLFLTACSEMVPTNALKAASHCGGISPDGGEYIEPFKECPLG